MSIRDGIRSASIPSLSTFYKEMSSGWKLWDILIWYIPNALPQPNSYMERLFDNKLNICSSS